MNKTNELIIGIDPDITKSGVVEISKNDNKTAFFLKNFAEMIVYIDELLIRQKNGLNLIVVIEAGWLNKSNWHLSNKMSLQVASKIGNSTGRNHQVGISFYEYLNHKNINCVLQKPLLKKWKGQGGKINAKEFNNLYSSIFNDNPPRTNQELRDAFLIAYNFFLKTF